MTTKRVPWTQDELAILIPKLNNLLQREEDEQEEEVKPLPPLTSEECLEYFARLQDAAAQRPLTSGECFIHGQLLCQYKQAVQAEMLGKKGRYYVISEQNVVQLISGKI